MMKPDIKQVISTARLYSSYGILLRENSYDIPHRQKRFDSNL